MSLLFIDSFKNYTYLPLKWDERTVFCGFYIKAASGRKGGNCLAILRGYKEIDNDFMGRTLSTNHEVLILGFAFKRVSDLSDILEIGFCDGDDYQSKVVLNNNGVSWYSGNANGNYGKYYKFNINTWYFLEIKIKAHSSLGELQIRVNERLILDLSNLDTITTANNYFNKIRFIPKFSSTTAVDYMYIDDLYLADDLGSVNNDFLGNCEISVVRPTSQGTFAEFTPSPTYSGATHYSLVNDLVYLEDTTTTYSQTYYEYAGADDGCYIQTTSPSNWVFDNNSGLVPHTSVYMNYAEGGTNSHYWFRFSGLNIPRNAKIIEAYILATNYDNTVVNPNNNLLQIYLQKIGTPANQVTSSTDFYSRSFTYNKYSGGQGTIISNRNISSSLQELVDLPDWQEENNSILAVVKLKYVNESVGGIWHRYYSYDWYSNPTHTNSPKFFVSWQLPGEDSGKYLKSSNLDDTEAYHMTTLSGSSDILAVNCCILAKREYDLITDNDMYLQATMISGSTTYFSTIDLPYNKGYRFTDLIIEQDPATNAPWTRDAILGNAFGFTTISG